VFSTAFGLRGAVIYRFFHVRKFEVLWTLDVFLSYGVILKHLDLEVDKTTSGHFLKKKKGAADGPFDGKE
jgi:hypothetical protein